MARFLTGRRSFAQVLIVAGVLLSLECVICCQAHAQDLEDSIADEMEKAAVTPPSNEGGALEKSATQELPAPAVVPAQQAQGRESIANDEPDLALEQRLFKIYSKAKPIGNEQWNEMIGSRKEDVYIIQHGDTFSGISKTMFGDSAFWPKLWAENGSVENPNMIFPKMGVRFISGTSTEAPTVDVVSAAKAETIRINTFSEIQGRAPQYREQALKDITPDEITSQNAIEVDELVAAPEIPPKKKERPVLKELPPSFVARKISLNSRYDKSGLDVGKRRSYKTAAQIIPTSYLAEELPANVGRVTEIETQEKVASIGQNIFLTLNRPARIGERLSVLYPSGKIQDPVRGAIGPIIEVGGTVEIFEALNEAKNIYRAQVLSSINPIRIQSLVVEARLPETSFERSGTRLNIELRIIGGEFSDKRSIIGENSVVYIDGGAEAGLTAGDILPIHATRKIHREDSVAPDWNRSIGLLKIVKVEKKVSTAIVMEASEEIIPGDHTGGALPEKLRDIRRGQQPEESTGDM